MKFTFKTDQPTGRYRSFDQPIHSIKLKKIVVGTISPMYPFKIQLKVTKADINEDGNLNCDWRWVKLKKDSKSLQEAKEFLNRNVDAILAKHKICLSY